MASDETLRAVITVLDRTAEPLRAINARFAGMSAPLRRIGAAVGEIAEQTGLKKIGEQARGALEHVRGLGEGLRELAGPLAALGAGASLAGLAETVKSTAEFAEKLQISSKLTGIATDQLAGWHYAAGLVNVDSEALDKGFEHLNKNMAAGAEQSKEVRGALAQLGIAFKPGQAINTAAALATVSTKVKALVDGGHMQRATYLVGQLFGQRGGMALLPLLEQGPEKIAEAMAAAKDAGLTLTESQTESGARFMENFKQMTASVQGLKLAIGNDLMPVLTPVIKDMSEWMNANREWMATKIQDAVKGFGDTLKTVDWKGIGADFKTIAGDAEWLVNKLGGIGPVIGIIAAVELRPAIAAWGKLGTSVAVAAGKFIAFPVASLVGTFATLVPSIGSARDAMAALSLAMDANPIGAVVAAVAVLAGAAYEVYEHWEPIKQFFGDLWDGVVAGFAAAWDKIKPIVDLIVSAANKIRGLAGGAIQSIGNAVASNPEYGGVNLPLSARPGAAAAAGAPANGSTKVSVDFKNMPQGTSVSTESRGNATPPDLNVGYAFPLN